MSTLRFDKYRGGNRMNPPSHSKIAGRTSMHDVYVPSWLASASVQATIDGPPKVISNGIILHGAVVLPPSAKWQNKNNRVVLAYACEEIINREKKIDTEGKFIVVEPASLVHKNGPTETDEGLSVQIIACLPCMMQYQVKKLKALNCDTVLGDPNSGMKAINKFNGSGDKITEYTCLVIAGKMFLTLTGEDPQTLRKAKLVLEGYLNSVHKLDGEPRFERTAVQQPYNGITRLNVESNRNENGRYPKASHNNRRIVHKPLRPRLSAPVKEWEPHPETPIFPA